ncbi:MAG: rhodanese-like domain-containing protein [Desulfobacteraceae bacterium]|nr:rhodanese-like domain-containing protein [Desulfobacteraceae bacterium]
MALKSISPEKLRQYIQSHHEKSYLLVDVRQPEEYQQSHIPGARLLPLPELGRSLEQLTSNQELVFYCRSGGRSMAAAAMTEEEGFKGTIYNLTGGMLAWDGASLTDFPRVALFAGQHGVEKYKTAMNLEKGAQIFYQTIARDHADQPWSHTFAQLAQAEEAHAKSVYRHWQQAGDLVEPFESIYNGLSGEVLEGGLPLKAALQKITAVGKDVCLRAMEMALQIEYAAFDLYRSLAHQSDTKASQEAFLQLSQAEKAHMQILITALDK